MTTIRSGCMNDVLRIPYLGLAVDLEVIPPPGSGTVLRSSELYNLVAEAPGNHIMAYLCASALESGKAKEKIIAIDECKSNILYKSTQPLQTLVCRLEEILGYAKKVSAIQVDVRGSESCSAGKMFAELGYRSRLLRDQNICRWTKSTKSTAAVASQASTAAVASQASTAAVASQASTADDVSQASTADDVSLEDIKAEFAAREALDCGPGPPDPSFLVPQEVLHLSMSGHINFACNSEFDLEDSGSDGEVGVSEFS